MNTLHIPAAKRHIEYPECMDELSPVQFEHYCRLFLKLKAGETNLVDFMSEMTMHLLDLKIPFSYNQYGPGAREIISDNFRQVMETLGWLLVQDPQTAEITPNISFNRNLLPRIGRTYGPSDALQDLTLGEFRDALGYSFDFEKNLSEDSLNLFCATLYRPHKAFWKLRRYWPAWDGQPRKRHNSQLLSQRAVYFSKMPFHLKFGAWLVFNAGLNFLRGGTVTIEGKEISFAKLWEGREEIPGIGMAGVLFSLAESGVFGTLREVERENLYVGLARLYQVMLQNEPKPKKP